MGLLHFSWGSLTIAQSPGERPLTLNNLSRRRFLTTLAASSAGAIALPALLSRQAQSADALKVGMLIPGQIDDGGFMEAGYKGLLNVEGKFQAAAQFIADVPPELDAMAAALRDLAMAEPDLVFAHGGQCSEAAELVAPDFPGSQFVVVQGFVIGENLSSYEILQEQSAWLGGALAGLMTETQVVGHISGIRVRPGLKGRAAFADGLRYTNPDAEFLTIFCGYQDDVELAKTVALAEIEAGADIIFTMLNAGRTGAIEACREQGIYQIGNVRDWYADAPEVFIASAIANVSMASVLATQDYVDGNFGGNVLRKVGLEIPEAVRLAMAPTVPPDCIDEIESLAQKIIDGDIEVPEEYDGPEFQMG